MAAVSGRLLAQVAEFEGGSVLADELVWNDSWMADHQVAEGWWIADDGRWFAPHLHPDVMAATASAADGVAEAPESADAVAVVDVAETPLVAARTDEVPTAEPLQTETQPLAEESSRSEAARESEGVVVADATAATTASTAEADGQTTWVVQPPLPYVATVPTEQPDPEPPQVQAGSVLESIRKAPSPLPSVATPAAEVETETAAVDGAGALAPRRTTTKPQPTHVGPNGPDKSGRLLRKVGALVGVVALGALVWFVGSELADGRGTADGAEVASSTAVPESAAADPIAIEAATTTTSSVAPTTTVASTLSSTIATTTTAADDEAVAPAEGDGNPATTQRKLGSLELKQLRDELYRQDLFAVVALTDAELSATAASVCQMAANADLDEDYEAGVGRLAGDLDVDILVAMAIGRVVLEQNCPDQIERLGL